MTGVAIINVLEYDGFVGCREQDVNILKNLQTVWENRSRKRFPVSVLIVKPKGNDVRVIFRKNST